MLKETNQADHITDGAFVSSFDELGQETLQTVELKGKYNNSLLVSPGHNASTSPGSFQKRARSFPRQRLAEGLGPIITEAS